MNTMIAELELFSLVNNYYDHCSSVLLNLLSANQIAVRKYNVKQQREFYVKDYVQLLRLDEIGIQKVDLLDYCNIIYPDDLPLYRKMLENVIKRANNTITVKYRCVGKNGELIWLEDYMLPLIDPSANKVVKVFICTKNIQEEQENKEKIVELEKQLSGIMLAMPAFMFVFDDDFVLRDILMSEQTTLLHSKSELIGKSGRNFYSPEVSELFIKNINGCLADGELREIEYGLEKNNVMHYFQARIVPYEQNKALALIFDIGDRVRRIQELTEAREKAERADKGKTAFLANMSHEIRTPLNAIVGFSEIVALEEDPENKTEYFSLVKKNSDLLLQIIDDILDMSRMESGKMEMHYQVTDLNALVEEVASVYHLKMGPEVELKLSYPTEKKFTLTDPNRVKQVLYNLLSNAHKNTEKGFIAINMTVQDEKAVLFSVMDTGRGIEKEKLTSIFARYEKLDDFVQGTGLGLAISKGIVERLGGRIYVTSELGKGSTFSFSIPLNKTPEELSRGITKGGSKLKILIVDNKEDFESISAILGDQFELIWAANERYAVELFINKRPNLILVNAGLPNSAGIEAVKKIREISFNVNILGMASSSYYTDQQLALENGCNDLLFKPYSKSSLQEAIAAYI